MDTKRITMIAIAITVGIVVFSSVLIPAVSNASTVTKSTAMNTTEKFLMADFHDSDEITIEYTGSTKISVNGNEFTVTSSYFTIGFSDKTVIRIGDSAMTLLEYDGTVTSNIVKIVYSSGTATMTKSDDTTLTRTWAYLFYPSSVGTWGYFQDAGGIEEDVYIDNNVTAYVVAWVSWNNTTNSSVYGSWKITNGTATNVVPAHYETEWNGTYYEDSDATVELHYTNSDDGLTKLYTGATFVINDYEYSNQAFIVAPLEYHYRTSMDNSMLLLYGAIPIFLLLSMIVATVSFIFVKYRK